MSPIKTVVTKNGICYTKEATNGVSFSLTLFRQEKNYELAIPRSLNLHSARLYDDQILLRLAHTIRNIQVSDLPDKIVITGPTGNQAILPKRR
ncbi:MAG: hypothetical protein US90_C0001G0070 [Candidatus Shapirobacteria bacterium GW2011_GWE2_38_30]|uniref:Uncharacterized protein n=1 Tax=Candidatus Shapirobacteria bacterium GW2011_GWE2_38_30 TaxID=1618490 RepID=A0A0G0MDC7_9BACT|nr:MAG: hypothetical protein US90_C0001G0070 [Candidatus Shapirobacteria bacterium GW2011_GWE2_38_30]